ncbi:unnamed protein product, partial [Vitis vinifera]
MVPLFIVTNNYSAFVFRHSITSGLLHSDSHKKSDS